MTLCISCVAVGVLLVLLIQMKMREGGREATKKMPATVLNPSSFSGGGVALEEQPTIAASVSEAPVSEAPVSEAKPVAAAPPGSGERWTPLS